MSASAIGSTLSLGRLEAADAKRATALEKPAKREIVVALNGAHVRSVPGYQVRHFEAIIGKVEVRGRPARRFALVGRVTEQPAGLVRTALADQGWQENQPVTVISDGDPALPALGMRGSVVRNRPFSDICASLPDDSRMG